MYIVGLSSAISSAILAERHTTIPMHPGVISASEYFTSSGHGQLAFPYYMHVCFPDAQDRRTAEWKIRIGTVRRLREVSIHQGERMRETGKTGQTAAPGVAREQKDTARRVESVSMIGGGTSWMEVELARESVGTEGMRTSRVREWVACLETTGGTADSEQVGNTKTEGQARPRRERGEDAAQTMETGAHESRSGSGGDAARTSRARCGDILGGTLTAGSSGRARGEGLARWTGPEPRNDAEARETWRGCLADPHRSYSSQVVHMENATKIILSRRALEGAEGPTSDSERVAGQRLMGIDIMSRYCDLELVSCVEELVRAEWEGHKNGRLWEGSKGRASGMVRENKEKLYDVVRAGMICHVDCSDKAGKADERQGPVTLLGLNLVNF
ncbi:hypothetical protein DFH09DRAFT_1069598 [Mycena vulgaris]|nr:hypothetical protein DFH09DRAFT_1069598 [Mycena vulgaris]